MIFSTQFKIFNIILIGVFTAPISGVYMLMVYTYQVPDQKGPMFIKSNDIDLCRMWVNPEVDATGACSAVAQLVIGDSMRGTGSSVDPTTLNEFYSGFVSHIISDNLTA